MTYKTHFNFGILFSTLFIICIYANNTNINNLLSFVLMSGIAALIPDYDHRKSYITKYINLAILIFLILYAKYAYTFNISIITLIWLILAKVTKHRTFTHSLIGTTIFVYPYYHTMFFIPILIGYASHIFADLLTERGCPLLYPFVKEKQHLLSMTTGSKTESILCLLLTIINVSLIALILLRII